MKIEKCPFPMNAIKSRLEAAILNLVIADIKAQQANVWVLNSKITVIQCLLVILEGSMWLYLFFL